MDPSELHNFLRTRRSVRRFLPQPIEEEKIGRILETAGFAPSAHNRQPWRFVVVRSAPQKSRLADALGEEFLQDLLQSGYAQSEALTRVSASRARINNAAAAVVLCADFSAGDSFPDEARQAADSITLVQDCALAGLQLMLAAHAEGLGTVWMCAPLFAPETVRFTLSLANTWEPQALILMGYPASIPAARERKPVDETSLWL